MSEDKKLPRGLQLVVDNTLETYARKAEHDQYRHEWDELQKIKRLEFKVEAFKRDIEKLAKSIGIPVKRTDKGE